MRGDVPRKASLRIGLYGLFGMGNTGNDASLEAMMAVLRRLRPEAELVCICGGPDNVRRDLGIPALWIRARAPAATWFHRLDRLLLRVPRALTLSAQTAVEARRFDVVLIPGTGILEDHGDRPWGDPSSLFAWCLLARAFGARVGFASVGAGPMRNHRLNRLFLKTAARVAQYRSYRDRQARDFMANIGVDVRRDAVAADLAFGLPEPADGVTRADAALRVGLGVMRYYGWSDRDASLHDRYLSGLAEFAVWLVRSGHHLRLLAGQENDAAAIAGLRERMRRLDADLPEDRIRFEPAPTVHDVMRQIAQTDVVVATRYHNVVCALKLDKPTMSIGYSKKHDVLLEDVGLGGFCQHADHLDVARLKEQFTALVDDRTRYEERLRQANADIRRRLDEQERALGAWLPE